MAELNFSNVARGTFYTPGNLPPNGTAGLSVMTGTVSAPPSGTLFSYTNYFDSTVYTITAAVDGNSPGFEGVTGVTTGLPTNTSTEVGPVATTQSRAVKLGGQRDWLFVDVCVIVGLFAML